MKKEIRKWIKEAVDEYYPQPDVLPAPVKEPKTIPDKVPVPKKRPNPLQPPDTAPNTTPKNVVNKMVIRYKSLTGQLKEALNYKDIFDTATMEKLVGQSKENLERIRREYNYGPESQMVMMSLFRKLNAIESQHIPELEQLAVQLVKELFPIVDYAEIQIHAKLAPMGEMGMEEDGEEEEGEDDIPDSEDYDQLPEVKKRRVINAITQGAASVGTFAYELYEEALNRISDSLKQEYNKLMHLSFGVYDDTELMAKIMAMMGSAKDLEQMSGGKSKARHNKETGVLEIYAVGALFPVLVQEIVKGLYEIVSLQGFGPNKEANKFIVKRADKVDHEIDDLRFGKYIYQALNAVYAQSPSNDPRVRELFFAEIYKLPDEEFITLIQNIVKGTLSVREKTQLNGLLQKIEAELQ